MMQTDLTGFTSDTAAINIERLRQIFPDVYEEGKINFDKLKQNLGEYIDGNSDRYDFSWHGKSQSLQLAQTPGNGTLRPFIKESKDWSTTKNLYIEGDNLEVLKLLKKSYSSRVKMIYIDPPYNTGNDFIYPDDYRDSLENYLQRIGQLDGSGNRLGAIGDDGGRFHTNWLNMIYPRLWLSRDLLTDDGVIFISIDDNEIDNLKKVCNEVFGEENYINLISLKTKASSGASGGGEDKRLKKNNEYLFIYAKTKSNMKLKRPVNKIRISDFIQKHRENNVGFYYTRILESVGNKKLLCNVDGMQIYIHQNYQFSTVLEKMKRERLTEDEVYYKYFNQIFMVTNAQTSLLDKVNQVTPGKGMLISYEYTPKTGRNRGVHTVKYVWNQTLVVWFADSAEKGDKFVYKNEDLGTLWDDISWGRLDLQGEVPFKNGKKPLKLLERIIGMATDRNSTVLDFFSGSATTAHAVMQLNAKDGGSRNFIMVQLPEPTDKMDEAGKAGYKDICEIGKERIRRAGEKLKFGFAEQNDEQIRESAERRESNHSRLDIGFKVFRTDSSNLKKWNPHYSNLEQDRNDLAYQLVPGRTELDVVYEIMLKCGLQLSSLVEQKKVPHTACNLYSVSRGALIICPNDAISADIAANEIVRLNCELRPADGMRVAFLASNFKEESTKVRIIEILKLGGVEEIIIV